MSFAEVLLVVAVAVVTVQLAASLFFTARSRRRRAAEAQRTAGASGQPSVYPPGPPDPRREAGGLCPLDEDAQRRYRSAWAALDARFADAPVLALTEADQLLGRLAADLGLPREEPGRRTPTVPAAQARVLADLRAGRAVEQRSTTRDADLDEVREAMRRFRRAFHALLEGAATDQPYAGPAARDGSARVR